MSHEMVHWGILGTATIARKNWLSIKNSGNGIVTTVASRQPARAKQFIDECQAEAPFPLPPLALSYEELIAAKNVDAIYLPLPTGLRKEWVLKAANAGKHVLVEKPVGVSAADVDEMLAACEKNKVQFMDGVMFMHSQRLGVARQLLDEPSRVGKIRRITVQFSFAGGNEFRNSNIRVNDSLEPAGCVGDLGWYCIRAILWAQGYELPASVSGRVISELHGVPMEFTAELQFKNGTTAGFFCSFEAENQQWLHISGTEGSLRIRDFVLPFYGAENDVEITRPKFSVNGCHFNMEERREHFRIDEYSNSAPNSQEANLFRNFAALVISGKPDPQWGSITRKTQLVMDACLASAREAGKTVPISS